MGGGIALTGAAALMAGAFGCAGAVGTVVEILRMAQM
jgi:hypothetical protein